MIFYKHKILLIEDDVNLGFIIQENLELQGFSVQLCGDGDEGYKKFLNNGFDLCLIDVMLPKMDGFTLAQEIRKTNLDIPIIFLTAKSLKEDRIKGFQTGCDDYITKPFSTEELSLRIEAVLKRCMMQAEAGTVSGSDKYSLGTYTFDAGNMSLKHNSGDRTLTRKETALLRILAKNKNKLINREFILKEVWGNDDYFLGRSMDVFIAKLRKYLKEDSGLSITNVHGAGFKLEEKE